MEEEALLSRLKLSSSPSFKRRFDSTISRESSCNELPRYTSLKDIIIQSTSPQAHHAAASCGSESVFDSSSISIRNELVKHAASMYVQSATIHSHYTRDGDQEYYWGLWQKIKSNCAGFYSCVRVPLHAFCSHVNHFFSRVAYRMRRAVRERVEIT